MSKMPILDVHGSSLGEYDFPDELLVLNRGKQAVQEVVVAYRAGLRAGTASTLNKGLVSGSNRKPWQQKGLGRARAGYRQSPIWRGGGVVFGPKPRSYAKVVPKGVAALAFARVMSDKINSGGLKVLNDLTLKDGKTREITALLNGLKVKGRALFIIEKPDENLKRAARNISNVAISLASDVNTYQIMLCPTLLATKGAMDIVTSRLKKVKLPLEVSCAKVTEGESLRNSPKPPVVAKGYGGLPRHSLPRLATERSGEGERPGGREP